MRWNNYSWLANLKFSVLANAVACSWFMLRSPMTVIIILRCSLLMFVAKKISSSRALVLLFEGA